MAKTHLGDKIETLLDTIKDLKTKVELAEELTTELPFAHQRVADPTWKDYRSDMNVFLEDADRTIYSHIRKLKTTTLRVDECSESLFKLRNIYSREKEKLRRRD